MKMFFNKGKMCFTGRPTEQMKYNTKVNNRYFKRHRLQQWGSRRCGYIPLLEDDMDIMERIDIFDTVI